MNRRSLFKALISMPLFGLLNEKIIPKEDKKFDYKSLYISKEAMEDIHNWNLDFYNSSRTKK
jgi:hypothetical protein